MRTPREVVYAILASFIFGITLYVIYDNSMIRDKIKSLYSGPTVQFYCPAGWNCYVRGTNVQAMRYVGYEYMHWDGTHWIKAD